jgi:integrase
VCHGKAFYRWAVLAGVDGANPSSRLTNPKLNWPLPRPVPDDDQRRAVALARPKMRLMILLGAFCGLRCQEIAGLHWTDLRAHSPGDLLTIGEAAEHLAQAIEKAAEGRRIRELP